MYTMPVPWKHYNDIFVNDVFLNAEVSFTDL